MLKMITRKPGSTTIGIKNDNRGVAKVKGFVIIQVEFGLKRTHVWPAHHY